MAEDRTRREISDRTDPPSEPGRRREKRRRRGRSRVDRASDRRGRSEKPIPTHLPPTI